VSKEYTLGKTERLKSRKIIDQLFNEGIRFSVSPFRVYYLESIPSLSPLQYAPGVSSKNFKKAVDRNRVKRLMKEAWRLQKGNIQMELKAQGKCLHVFMIYTAKKLPVYSEVVEKTEKVIAKLNSIINLSK
jgi:ribonuclease P protein component